MTVRKTKTSVSTSEGIGLKLLQSVREMKARKFARVAEVEVNARPHALYATVLPGGTG